MKKIYLLTLGLLAFTAGNAQTFSGGEGTQASPYKITKLADFTELATAVADGQTFTGKYFSLENDVTVGSSETFTPIGAATPQFDGTFDGKHHTISGITLDGAKHQAMFGHTGSAATIKNLIISNASITSSDSYSGFAVAQADGGLIDSIQVVNGKLMVSAGSYNGGVVGYSKYGTVVSNCSFSGSVQSAQSFGGIVGQNFSTINNCWSNATIVSLTESTSAHFGGIAAVSVTMNNAPTSVTDSYFLGTIQGATGNNVAGIVATSTQATVERCWNGGYLSSYNGYVGGIVANHGNGTIRNCYNAGTVYDVVTTHAGGITGHSANANTTNPGQIINCINYGSLFNNVLARNENCEIYGTTTTTPVVLTSVYFDSQVSGWGSTSGAKTTTELTSGTALEGFDTSIWTFAQGMYPRLTATATTDAAVLAATPFYLTDGERHDKVTKNFTVSTANDVEWSITGTTNARLSGNNVTVTRTSNLANVVLHSYLGDYEKRALVNIYPVIFSGAGTEADPYLITNFADLKKLSDATNNDNMTFQGEYFKMTADIDCESDTSFNVISPTSQYAFSATFDGDGHSIKNWAIDTQTGKLLNAGLFAFVSQFGTIKNLTIDKSCQFKVYRNFGPFSAYFYGKLENCRNYADVVASAGFSGGLVYIAQTGSEITDCYNEGKVVHENPSTTSSGYLGGVCYNNYGTITGTQNAGEIEANYASARNVGGLVGYNQGTISESLNTGHVFAGRIVGGITGTISASSNISNTLSLGVVQFLGASSEAGAIVGSTNASAKFSNATFDSQIVACNNVEQDGIVGKLTSELVANDFGGDKWSHTSGYLPTLKAFATETPNKLEVIPVVTFASADTRETVTTDATLASADGLTYALKNGEKFQISGTTLKYIESDKPVTDSLTVTYNGYQKIIPVASLGNVFTGSGTEADPYIIATPQDLVTLSTTVESTGNTFDGKVFKVTNDLDMKGIEFAPIGSTTTKFNATFKGAGHTISNLAIAGTASNTGLFGVIGGSGSVDSLTIASGTITSDFTYTGSFAGVVEGKLSNVTNYASVTSTKNYGGGIVGNVPTGGYIHNVKNYGTVKVPATYVGGVAGQVVGPTGNVISDLYNYGEVNGKTRVGGVIGYANGPGYERLHNEGYVKGDSTSTSSYVGGIFGYTLSAVDTVKQVSNLGNVKGGGNVGGICGYFTGSSSKRTVLTESYNAGNVTGIASVGGLVGYTSYFTVTKSANVGNVTNTKTGLTASTAGAAGLVARGLPTIEDCFTSGIITAENNVGQVLGYPYSTSTKFTVTNVVAAGSVDGTVDSPSSAGAIQGKTSTNCTFTNVYFDKQQCKFEAVANAAATGVSGLRSAELTGITAPGDEWTVEANRYPRLKAFETDTAVLVATLPVFLDEADTRYAVTKRFQIGTAKDFTWSADDAFIIDDNSVAIKQGTVGDYVFVVKSGNYSYVYNLAVNCPEGTAVTDINVDDDNAPVEYYNLQGIRVAEPANGIFIRKQGSKSSKVVVK